MTTDFKQYFASKYPEEAAGYFKDGVFFPLENISTGDKRLECAVDNSFLLSEPDVFMHSHTTGWKQFPADYDPRSPSKKDMETQLACDIEFALVTTDGENTSDPLFWGNPEHRPELVGREFIFNIQDCLSLAQDWFYKERNIVLPNIARNPYWHDEGENHMEDLYTKWGFVDVNMSEVQVGDVFLYAIRSEVIRHIGIYVGENKVLSHWYGRLSAVEDFGTWAKYIKRTIRYKGAE